MIQLDGNLNGIDNHDVKVKIISDITENDDNYSWKEVNCFYKPIAILAKSFNQEFFDIFLFYVSYYGAFSIGEWFSDYTHDNKIPHYNFYKFFEDVLKDRLGLFFKIIEFTSEDEMHNKIKKEIDSDARILIPGDLFALYYDQRYKREHHMHFFIAKGYDTERKIYYILDTLHIDNGFSKIFKDFSIQLSTLSEVCTHYFTHYYPETPSMCFWSLNQFKPIGNYKYANLLLDHLDHLKKININESIVKYLEYEFVKTVNTNNNSINIDNLIWDMVSSSNLKSVYYNILFKTLHSFNIDPAESSELNDMKNRIVNCWTGIRNKIMHKSFKKESSYTNLMPIIEANLQNERLFREKLIDILEKLNLKILLQNQSKAESSLNFIERNVNKALLLKEENKVTITHSADKVYNLWAVQDEAPQMLIYVGDSSDFYMQSKVTIISNNCNNYYQSGIIIRMDDGKKILFGEEMDLKISILCPEFEENCHLYSEAYLTSSVYLKVERITDKFNFFYKYKSDMNWIYIYTFKYSGAVKYFGLFSKTWDNIDLKVEFTDLKYEKL